MHIKKILAVFAVCVMGSTAAPLFELDFTSGEGFSEGAGLSGISGMGAQPFWYAADVNGDGYAYSTNQWARAENYASFTLDVDHSLIIEATIRLTDADGTFSNGELFQFGFAESSQHSGGPIPSIGAKLYCSSDGGYAFGGDSPANRITVSSTDSGDWIRLTQTITRDAADNTFLGLVSASNLTDGVDIGTAAASWTQTTTDGSWGGSMQAAFRTLGNAQVTAVELDGWTAGIYTGAPPVVTNPPIVIVTNAPLYVLVDPEVSMSIGGHLELDRRQFICLADTAKNFETKINNAPQVDYYVDDLGMYFGRELGGAYGAVGWNSSAIREDSSRPGYVDMNYLANNLNGNNGGASSGFINQFSPNLNIAQHDRYGTGTNPDGSVPSFMDAWVATGDDPLHRNAVNAAAYGEFVAGVLEHGYTDWTRPATYEIVNEPDWRVWGDQRFADIHTEVKAHVEAAGLDVAVGGPCMSVGYFYKNNYQTFNMKQFIINTGCNLDFYSFHVYDYMGWDAAANDFNGRVSTGLPVEGVLDLVQSYTENAYGKPVDMVLSEHGGYISTDKEAALDTIANTYFPGSGFEWEMKRRSVSECLAVRSAIANTMAFMNNPHVVRKAVPFILLESAGWDPTYYSVLLVKENFDKNSSVWHESTYVNFFRYFKNVSGRRVRMLNDDPDIQSQAYVDGDKLYILFNNLASSAQPVDLDLPLSGVESISLRRFGRNWDYTPFFTEASVGSLDGLMIGSREALAIEVDYTDALQEKLRLDEVPYYATQYEQEFTGSRSFNIQIPEYADARSAVLRIGVGRGIGTDHDMEVTFNGTPLEVPMEDCADYLENDNEYGSMKLMYVPASLLQLNNTVNVTFPGGGHGGIGAVTVRAALEQSVTGPTYSQWALDHGLSGSNLVKTLDLDVDGFDNWSEYAGDTDPLNGASYLVAQGGADPAGFKVAIDSRTFRRYAVEYANTLTNAVWADLTNNIPGTGSLIELIDSEVISNRFYRIRSELE